MKKPQLTMKKTQIKMMIVKRNVIEDSPTMTITEKEISVANVKITSKATGKLTDKTTSKATSKLMIDLVDKEIKGIKEGIERNIKERISIRERVKIKKIQIESTVDLD